MTGELLDIRNAQDLFQALVKAKRIEEAFEEVLHWQGFLTIQDPKAGEVLKRLVRDSETHERLVDSLIKIVEPHAPPRKDAKNPPIVIDGDGETQFLEKLLEGEDMAHYVYSAILDALANIDARAVGGEHAVAELRRVLGQLVSAEKRHRDMVSELLAARRAP